MDDLARVVAAGGPARTAGQAPPAADAALGEEEQLAPCLLSLRVGAPQAPQRATLEVDHRAYAAAVVYGVALDTQDATLQLYAYLHPKSWVLRTMEMRR